MVNFTPRGKYPLMESEAKVSWGFRVEEESPPEPDGWRIWVMNPVSPTLPQSQPPLLLGSACGQVFKVIRRKKNECLACAAGGRAREHLRPGLCDDYLQLLIRPLQELNLLVVLLLLHLSPLTLPLFGGFTFCLLLVHLPLQISLFCF